MINDLLDPTGQNLRVREDAQVINLCSRTIPCFLLVACCISFVDLIERYIQGTYVEGIKEEVVLSPGHALSFIAAGEGTYTNYSCHVLRFFLHFSTFKFGKCPVKVFFTELGFVHGNGRAPSCWIK